MPADSGGKRKPGGLGRLYAAVWKIIDKFVEDNITLYSAQTAYFVVVSMIPFAIVMVPMMMLLIPEDTINLVNNVVLMLPESMGGIVDRVLNNLFKTPGTSVISLYLILSLWAASKGIMSLETGLHGIYHIRETENYFVRRLRCCLYTLILLGVIIITLLMLVMGNTLDQIMSIRFSFWASIARFILAFRLVIAIVVFVVAFTAAYKYLSGARCSFLEALPGVTLTTAAWFVFSGIYSYYIDRISQYITLYGSLGALVFLFLWLYFCILILMIGAEFNVCFAGWRRRRKLRREREMRQREETAAAAAAKKTEVKNTAAGGTADRDREEQSEPAGEPETADPGEEQSEPAGEPETADPGEEQPEPAGGPETTDSGEEPGPVDS